MLCLKKRRTYSFTQGVCTELPRRTKEDNRRYQGSLNMAITTLPRKNRTREERPSRMILTVTEDTPADMLAGSMELLVQLPRDHHVQTQRVTVQRSTPMMDLLVQIATAHKLAASSYTLQAIGERGMVLPHQPNTPIGALDALQVKLLPKQGTFVPRKAKQANQPFETTFRLQVHLPRNQLYVSRVSPKMNLGEILDEVCREKNLDKNKYELRHPANLEETLDLSLTLQDYHLQEVTLYAKQGRTLGSALSTQDIMALQRQEERRRQQAKQGVFSFYKKSKESSLSTDSLGGRSASPARSDETGRSSSPLQPPARPQRKRRPAPKPPIQAQAEGTEESSGDSSKDKVVISHSRNSSDSSGYHEASVLSDNPESTGRLPETLPRRNKVPTETPRKLAQTSQSSKSLGNLATVPGTLSHGISSTSISSTGLRKKRAAPPPPVTRPLSSAISSQGLERIVDSEESLTSDIDPSKPPSDISASSKANSDIEERPKASSDIGVTTIPTKLSSTVDFTKSDCPKADAELKSSKSDIETRHRSGFVNVKLSNTMAGNPTPIEDAPVDARVSRKRVGEPVPLPKPRKAAPRPVVPKRKLAPSSPSSKTLSSGSDQVERLLNAGINSSIDAPSNDTSSEIVQSSTKLEEKVETVSNCSTSESEVFLTPGIDQSQATFDYSSVTLKENEVESLTTVQTDNKEEKEVSSSTEKNIENPSTSRGSSNQEKKLCAVISTIPKCEVLNTLNVDNTKAQNKEKEGLKDPKRTRIPRTASKSNDFETNSLERQRRHLTSQLEDITFALNLNVASNVGLSSDRSEKFQGNAQQLEEKENDCSQGVGGGKSHPEMSASDKELSETDVLLQKVSDTLSNEKASIETKSKINISKYMDQKNKDIDSADSSNSTNAMNLTANSQQDTSDYVSAADEDLSIAEWEYQLPAPPSAFRDSSSPVFDNFDEITPPSETTKNSKIKEPEFSGTNDPKDSLKKHDPNKQESKESQQKETTREKVFKQQFESSLRKEVINELENKINSLPQTTKDVDSRRASSISSAPKVAPVDNTLSNFTITTYTRQKNLNIFDEVEQQSRKNSDERFVRSFATLSRNQDRDLTDFSSGTVQEKKQEPKMNKTETLQRWQTNNEKSNIQRSKSYLSVCDKAKFQGGTCEDDDKNSADLEMDAGMKKATSINSLNSTAVRSNEKFSRWRDNILKRQEEPTKESQLQSVQVLKSILPQLKSAQQAEENVSKELNNTVLQEKTRPETTTSNEHSMESNVVSTRDSQTAPSNKKSELESKKLPSETSAKRYTYSGPPAITLGSWSDRSSVNVQIKKDTAYKFGTNKSSNKTVVDINGSKEETNGSVNMEDTVKSQRSKFEIADKREPNELTKKLITHTTASGFKKPVLNKVNSESKTVSDKPVVTGVELKKSFLENKQDDSVIDTTPMNFKELSKAFDQEVYLRPKPKRINVNRRSDLQLEKDSSKQNGHVNSDQCSTNGFQDNSKIKRFTTIVGVQPQNQTNLAFRNAINGKCNPSMPVVKGFKISNVKIEGNQENQNNLLKERSKELNGDSQPPKPPTMPVITGVTLKSARPKSMPVQMDSRDMLLESIRNFGGRENLKNAAGRC